MLAPEAGLGKWAVALFKEMKQIILKTLNPDEMPTAPPPTPSLVQGDRMCQDFRRSAHDWNPPYGCEAIPESEKPIQRTIGIRNFHMRSPGHLWEMATSETPIPWRDAIVPVHANPLRLSCGLSRHVVPAVADERQCHAVADHFGFDIDAIGLAERDGSAEAVLRFRLASYRVPVPG